MQPLKYCMFKTRACAPGEGLASPAVGGLFHAGPGSEFVLGMCWKGQQVCVCVRRHVVEQREIFLKLFVSVSCEWRSSWTVVVGCKSRGRHQQSRAGSWGACVPLGWGKVELTQKDTPLPQESFPCQSVRVL